MERAKELFLKYNGNRFHMDREGDGGEYGSYHVSRETEELWAEEYVLGFLEAELHGREALRAYAGAAEMVRQDRQEDLWKRCLHYPFRAEHLDDVTVLYMLQVSFRMAERAAGRQRLSRTEAEAWIRELNVFIPQVLERMEKGTMTRAADYTAQEFSDPVYTEGWLKDLKKKWESLPAADRS